MDNETETKRKVIGSNDDSPICRCCMAGKSYYISITESRDDTTNEPLLHQMLSECIRYKVDLNDSLPRKICLECADDVRTAFRLKKRAEESYLKLCSLYHQKQVEVVVEKPIELKEQATQTEKHIYSCELCLLKFYDPADLQTHRKTDHQGVERKCRFCDKSFELLRQLKSHLIQEHPDQYIATNLQCQICERKFSRRDHLQRHMRNIHKTEESKGFPRNVAADMTIEHPIDCVEVINKTDWGDDQNGGGGTAKNPIMSDDDGAENGINFDAIFCKNIKVEPDDAKETKAARSEKPENVVIKVELPNYESDDNNDYAPDAGSGAASASTDSEDDDNSLEKSFEKNQSETATTTPNFISVKPSVYRKKRRIRSSGLDRVQENRCNLCQRVFSRQCHLRRHMQSAHTNEKPHKCTHCDKRFTRSDHLKMHVMNVHEIKAHKCDMCDKAFVKNEALLRHKEVRHGDASGVYKIHECEFCKRKFTGKRYLARHRLLHTDRIFACRFCESTFKDRKLFREHERQHSSTQRNFLCSICGESFVRNDYLRVHMRRHLGEKPYKCQYCDKGFPRATDVKVHERYHTGTKPNVCTICGKAFHRAYNLTIHMRIHTGEKPYKCDHCSKSFAQSNDLKAHVRRHTGERFKCQECDASFLQLYGLRQHALTAHGTHIESSTGRLQKVGCLNNSSSNLEITKLAAAPPISSGLNSSALAATSHSTEMNSLNLLHNGLTTTTTATTPQQQQDGLMPLEHQANVVAAPSAAALHQQMHHPLAPPLALIYPNVPTIDAFKNQHYMQMK